MMCILKSFGILSVSTSWRYSHLCDLYSGVLYLILSDLNRNMFVTLPTHLETLSHPKSLKGKLTSFLSVNTRSSHTFMVCVDMPHACRGEQYQPGAATQIQERNEPEKEVPQRTGSPQRYFVWCALRMFQGELYSRVSFVIVSKICWSAYFFSTLLLNTNSLTHMR